MYKGASKPSRCRKSDTSDAVAPSPSICTTGSPGTRWISRKTTETTTHRTGSVVIARRTGLGKGVRASGFTDGRFDLRLGVRSDRLNTNPGYPPSSHLFHDITSALVIYA